MSTEEGLIKVLTDMYAAKKKNRHKSDGGGGDRGGAGGAGGEGGCGGGGGDLSHKDEIPVDEGTQFSEEEFQDSEKALLQSTPEEQAEWAASLKAIFFLKKNPKIQ